MVADCSAANSSFDSLSLSLFFLYLFFFFFNLLNVFNVIGEGS